MRVSERGSENRRQRHVRAGLVVTQVAVSTILLMGGGLLLRTFITMRATETGWAGGTGVTARDPLTIGVTAGGLLVVALLAAAAPALRASRIDPASALRRQ